MRELPLLWPGCLMMIFLYLVSAAINLQVVWFLAQLQADTLAYVCRETFVETLKEPLI